MAQKYCQLWWRRRCFPHVSIKERRERIRILLIGRGKYTLDFRFLLLLLSPGGKGRGKTMCSVCTKSKILFVGMASLPKHSLFPLLPRSLSRSRNLAEGPFVPLDSSLSAAEWVGLGAIKFVMKWSLPPSLPPCHIGPAGVPPLSFPYPYPFETIGPNIRAPHRWRRRRRREVET